eukprot:Pgem_evm1s15480
MDEFEGTNNYYSHSNLENNEEDNNVNNEVVMQQISYKIDLVLTKFEALQKQFDSLAAALNAYEASMDIRIRRLDRNIN